MYFQLNEWWRVRYLKSRDPLAMGTNFAGAWINLSSSLLSLINAEVEATNGTSIRAKSMAIVLRGLMEFWVTLRKGKIPPFKDRRGQPYCMHQHKYFLNTTRIPNEGEDIIEHHFKADDTCPSHFIIIHKGRFYKCDPVHQDGNLWSDNEIEAAFLEVENNTDGQEHCVGSLTCTNRDTWARCYQHLKKLSPGNASALSDISRAVCVVVLSDMEPKNEDELFYANLIHDGSNIWADKSLNFNAFKNGLVGSQSDVMQTKLYILGGGGHMYNLI